jgi:alkanesulfonate monooxygenase SsuD/methylene tetrahydromethanopterin reductase-like flavin-dependent oxidoreductase (luciferase family)
MADGLPLASDLQFGFITGFEDGIPTRVTAELAMKHGYDSVWTGDHVIAPVPMLDPFQQLAQLAALTEGVRLGTCVYLLPLRHPVHAAKQITTIDQLCDGQFVFGVGVGGEFPDEWAACEIPVGERGARLSAALPLVRSLARGEPTQGDGRFYHFPETTLVPAARRAGGPPIWLGGGVDAALRRIARLADGWLGYLKTPEDYAAALEKIAREADACGRRFERFDAAHLLCVRVDDDSEAAYQVAKDDMSFGLSLEYGFATRRHAALGTASEVAEQVDAYRRAGLRHVIVETLGPGDRVEQLARFAEEVRPLL